MIIALPENYTRYDPDEVLKEFTEKFKGLYGVECTSALHYNKTKTNYHIHLIFSERRLLETPDNKIATRAVYFDEAGKRVRTKKEITGEDGLECSEVLYSSAEENKDFRVDSQFYTMAIDRNIKLEYCPIGRYLISTQYGVSKDMNADGYGYPIYRMNEIHYSLCDLTTEKYVELTSEEFEAVKLNSRDVLFNRTNSFELVGRTGVYYDSGIPQTFASYLVRLIPDNIHIYSEYLAAFLSTRFGIQEIRRRARQSINQTNVNPEEVKAIEIPLLKREFQEAIRKCYEKAHQLRKNSAKKYIEADAILAQKTGIDKTTADDATAIKTL